MSTDAGIWIDHRKAIIVLLSDAGDETKIIESDVEDQMQQWDDASPSKPFGTKHMAPGNLKKDRRQQQYLNMYYDNILGNLKHADRIWVAGPGEAKHEFQKRSKTKSMQNRVIAVEAADTMTKPQFVAKVKKHFKQLQNG